jgi:hypothetical protein
LRAFLPLLARSRAKAACSTSNSPRNNWSTSLKKINLWFSEGMWRVDSLQYSYIGHYSLPKAYLTYVMLWELALLPLIHCN